MVVHLAVSLDGRTAGFVPDDHALRRLAGAWPGARILGAGEPGRGDLLGEGLVDEISLLVHPVIAGEGHPSWSGGARLPPGLRLVRRSAEWVDPGLAWLRFDVLDGGGS